MAIQPPLIDGRTLNDVLKLTSELIEAYTRRIITPITREALIDHIVDQDIRDADGRLIAANGTYINSQLAALVSQVPDLTQVKVRGWQKPGTIINVDLNFKPLIGSMIAEDVVHYVQTPTGKQQKKIIAGTVVDGNLLSELRQDPTIELIKVKLGPDALLAIFARFAWLIIQRLNRAPEKNFLAFLDLLGASLLPPEPARVPVTFLLTSGSTVDAVVPAGTQVAAPPAEGEKNPVIYETEKELIATAAQLSSLFVREPALDLFANPSALLAVPTPSGVPIFSGVHLINHVLYIGSSLFGLPDMQTIRLTIELTSGFDHEPVLVWEFWNGSEWEIHVPETDETENLTRVGPKRVIFGRIGEMLKPIPLTTVNAVTDYWIRCRLATALDTRDTSQLPQIASISVRVTTHNASLPLTSAFANLVPVDLNKDFFPFGEKPKYGDTFYLASDKAFSAENTAVTLMVTINNPTKVGTRDARSVSEDLQLTWEFWNGIRWQPIGVSVKNGTGDAIGDSGFEDYTRAFTMVVDADLRVSFNFPAQPAPVTINGVTSYWIRVRLSQGNYGKEASYTPTGTPPGYQFQEATFAPPSLRNLSVDYSLTTDATRQTLNVFTYNDFTYTVPTGSFSPFQPTPDTNPTLYLGFTLPMSRLNFPNKKLSLYFQFADIRSDQSADNPNPASPPRLVWEYWNGLDWIRLIANDETAAFAYSGLIEVLTPADFTQNTEFGLLRYWLRVRWESGDFKFLPRLQTVLPNTITAAQTVTMTNETLGSSNGTQNQKFRTTRAPVMQSQHLQVREPEMPSEEEQARLQEEQGKQGLSVVYDSTGRPKEVWVGWKAVPDFYGSGGRDRHYVIDHLTGEIRFGDGVNGRIPPIGIGNIRMSHYKTGGGQRGNRAAGAIVQLKTTVPYIDKVVNPLPAWGGSESESIDSLIERAPRTIRHRDRAVTIEDHEDLAKLSTPEVARAKCVPLFDLAADRDATQRLPGTISLIVVPRSTDPRPVPSMQLIEKVQRYLDTHRIPTANLVVVGPEYVKVNVTVEIALTSLNVASQVELAVNATLRSFLHPLTGGLDGTGWDFGRQPYQSDVYALLEATPGVDHVRTLMLTSIPDRQDADQTGRFLVYAGDIHTTFTME